MNKELRLGQVKAVQDEDMVVEGYALKFNTVSEDLGGFVETILPEALSKTDLSDVRCFVGHDTSKILGRTTSKTLQLTVDDVGLKVRCEIPNTTLGRDTYESIKRGDLNQMSFGFELANNGDRVTRANNGYLRELTNIKRITEVSIVSIPAYRDTDIAVAQRSLEKAINKERSFTLDNLKEQLREMKEAINTKISEQRDAANSADLEKAREVKAEIEQLQAELAQKETELAELEELANAQDLEIETPSDETVEEVVEEEDDKKEDEEENRSEEVVESEVVEEKQDEQETRSLNDKGDKQTMNLNELNQNTEAVETRSAINAYIRTKGMETRGVTTVEGGAVIPHEVITTPQETPQTVTDLRKYVNKVSVNTISGSYPVLGAQNAVMNTVAELAKNPELANPSFTDVDFKIETYRGAIAVSQEALDDAAIDLTSLIASDIQKQALNTTNAKIAAAVKTFAKKTVADLDGLKAIMNVDLDPAYDVKLYVSQSFFNAVDTMKDQNGRYILAQDITVASGAKLFGREVVILADNVIGAKAGDMVAFVGDLKAAVAFFDRKEVSVKWQDHSIYGQYLAAMLRFDVKPVDTAAGFYVTLAPVTKPAG